MTTACPPRAYADADTVFADAIGEDVELRALALAVCIIPPAAAGVLLLALALAAGACR